MATTNRGPHTGLSSMPTVVGRCGTGRAQTKHPNALVDPMKKRSERTASVTFYAKNECKAATMRKGKERTRERRAEEIVMGVVTIFGVGAAECLLAMIVNEISRKQ